MINLLWRRLYPAPPEEDTRDKLETWTESKKKISSILFAKAAEIRRRRSFAQAEIDAVAEARQAQMATIPGATQPDTMVELNRKVEKWTTNAAFILRP